MAVMFFQLQCVSGCHLALCKMGKIMQLKNNTGQHNESLYSAGPSQTSSTALLYFVIDSVCVVIFLSWSFQDCSGTHFLKPNSDQGFNTRHTVTVLKLAGNSCSGVNWPILAHLKPADGIVCDSACQVANGWF